MPPRAELRPDRVCARGAEADEGPDGPGTKTGSPERPTAAKLLKLSDGLPIE